MFVKCRNVATDASFLENAVLLFSVCCAIIRIPCCILHITDFNLNMWDFVADAGRFALP